MRTLRSDMVLVGGFYGGGGGGFEWRVESKRDEYRWSRLPSAIDGR